MYLCRCCCGERAGSTSSCAPSWTTSPTPSAPTRQTCSSPRSSHCQGYVYFHTHVQEVPFAVVVHQGRIPSVSSLWRGGDVISDVCAGGWWSRFARKMSCCSGDRGIVPGAQGFKKKYQYQCLFVLANTHAMRSFWWLYPSFLERHNVVTERSN